MTELAGWAAVGIALTVLVVRRRSVALGLVAVQSLAVASAALAAVPGRSADFAAACVVLVVRALVLPAVLTASLLRTRESRRVVPGMPPAARLTVGIGLTVGLVALVPPFGLATAAAEHASVGLVVLGITTVMLRRPTLFQILGLLIAENGLAVAAIAVPGGLPFVMEIGIVVDITVLVMVAAAFSERIFGRFGTGDTSLLRELRD